MFNGKKYNKDKNGNYVFFYITDDVPAMRLLNSGKACYLYTYSPLDINNNTIARYYENLPQYINCLYDSSNNVTASMDLGLPKEIYMGNMAYQEQATIYYNFWKKFYTDQFHIDTKKLTCFVKLDYMNQERLRDFYYFDNAL